MTDFFKSFGTKNLVFCVKTGPSPLNGLHKYTFSYSLFYYIKIYSILYYFLNTYILVMFMKGLKVYIIKGLIFVSVLGTLFHFAYEWSGNNVFVGLFTPVNESIWEHTKLLFFPMLIYSLYLRVKVSTEYPCINSSMILGTLSGIALIIVLYYTYSGIIGFNVAFADILIFYISVIASFYIVYKTTLSCVVDSYSNILQIIQIAIICLFILFTFSPPSIPLFISPQ